MTIIKIIRKFFFLLNTIYNKVFNKLVFIVRKINIKRPYKINGKMFIRNKGRILIGKNFKANSGRNFNPIGGDTILRLICKKEARIIIGNNVGISNSTIYCAKEIVIEDNVLIGGGCKIWDTDFHSTNPEFRGTKQDKEHTQRKSITIKKNAFIGGCSIILKGVTLGQNSIIAAGSIVTKNIPDNEIWGGNPAKFIRKIEE